MSNTSIRNSGKSLRSTVNNKYLKEEKKFNESFKGQSTKPEQEKKEKENKTSLTDAVAASAIASAAAATAKSENPENMPEKMAKKAEEPTEKVWEQLPSLSEATRIKNNVGNALEEKFGDTNAKKIIAGIDDAEIEKNFTVAEDTVSKNINSGKISKHQTEKYPYMLDAFAVMYAASDIGNKKLENDLYKLAYTEGEVGINSKSYTPKTDFSSLADSAKVSADSDSAIGKNELTNTHKEISKLRYDIDAEDDDSGSEVYASTPKAEITAYSNKLKEGKGPVIEKDEPETGLPAIGSLSNGYPHTISKILENSIKNFKKINGESYCDLTANGEGLDAELDPTPLEAARMAQVAGDFLTAGGTTDIKPGTEVDGWILTEDGYQNNQGLDIAVFKKTVNGKDCYVIVNVGSQKDYQTKEQLKEFGVDLYNNVSQPFGFSKDMKDSIAFSKKFVEEHPNANIIFVGHSKGGAEAAANAVANGKKAILFNPAKANFEAYDLDIDNYEGEMTSYVVDGEVLDWFFTLLKVDGVGEKIYLSSTDSSKENPNSWMQYLKDVVGDSIDKHILRTIIEILEEKESDEEKN